MTFTQQVSLFWILREKGIDIIEWLYPATFMHCIQNSQDNSARQRYYPHSWWENTLWKVENLPRSYCWEGCTQARMCLWCHAEAFSILTPKGRNGYPRGSPTALVWNLTWDRQHRSSRHILPPRTGTHIDCRPIHGSVTPFIITVLSQFI